MKQFFKKVMNVLEWITATAGLLLVCYGAYFQTVGFTLISVWMCVTFFFIGMILGGLYIYYMYRLIQKERALGKKGVGPEMVGGTGSGLVILFFLSLIVTYFAPSVLYFYGGLTGMTLSWFGELLFLIWKLRTKKQYEEENREIHTYRPVGKDGQS